MLLENPRVSFSTTQSRMTENHSKFCLELLEFPADLNSYSQFRLSYYPHRLDDFKNILKDVFGKASRHEIFGDFKPVDDSSNSNPAFYVHVIEKHK